MSDPSVRLSQKSQASARTQAGTIPLNNPSSPVLGGWDIACTHAHLHSRIHHAGVPVNMDQAGSTPGRQCRVVTAKPRACQRNPSSRRNIHSVRRIGQSGAGDAARLYADKMQLSYGDVDLAARWAGKQECMSGTAATHGSDDSEPWGSGVKLRRSDFRQERIRKGRCCGYVQDSNHEGTCPDARTGLRPRANQRPRPRSTCQQRAKSDRWTTYAIPLALRESNVPGRHVSVGPPLGMLACTPFAMPTRFSCTTAPRRVNPTWKVLRCARLPRIRNPSTGAMSMLRAGLGESSREAATPQAGLTPFVS